MELENMCARIAPGDFLYIYYKGELSFVAKLENTVFLSPLTLVLREKDYSQVLVSNLPFR